MSFAPAIYRDVTRIVFASTVCAADVARDWNAARRLCRECARGPRTSLSEEGERGKGNG